MSQDDVAQQVASLAAEVIDRIADDENFREAMKQDPARAMELAGFADRVDEIGETIEQDSEVSGFASISPRISGISIQSIRGGTILASSPPSVGSCNPQCSGAFNAIRPR